MWEARTLTELSMALLRLLLLYKAIAIFVTGPAGHVGTQTLTTFSNLLQP